MEVRRLAALLQPYGTPQTYEQVIKELTAHPEMLRMLLPQILGDAAAPGQPATSGATIPTGNIGSPGQYGGDMLTQVHRYALLAVELARHEKFDVIHAHDWMTYPAGIAVANATGKPLVVHVHSTEFDRSG
ncbi:MAG: glycosyltransferase family 1 protein, partial [Planctomycetaceae bacterium]